MKTNTHLWSDLNQFYFEWEVYQIKAAEKIKTRILNPVTFFRKKDAVYEIVWKNIVEP